MLRVDWNGLQAGDRVLVHDGERAMRLLAGVVVSNTPVEGSRNDVAIKVAGRPAAGLMRPDRLTVHHDPIEFDGHCWRCTIVGGGSSGGS